VSDKLFASAAPYLTDPLVLAGFALFLFIGLLRALLKSKVMPAVRQSAAGRIALRALGYGFVLALVVVVLGFGLAYFRETRQTVDAETIVKEFAAAAAARAEGRAAELDRALKDKEKEAQALRAAILALAEQKRQPGPPPGIDQALDHLRRGDATQAEVIFESIVARREAEGASALKEAAAAPRHIGALAYRTDARESLAAYERASRLDPTDAWDLIFAARLHRQLGNLAAAEGALRAAAPIAARSRDGRDREVVENELSDVRVAQDDLPGALAAYRAGLEIAERLAKQDPGNAAWQRDLSVSHNKIGDVRRAQGDLPGALAAYRAGLDIRERLAKQDPGNAAWQRDLSVSRYKIGLVVREQGDRTGARQRLEQAVEGFRHTMGPSHGDTKIVESELAALLKE
jgi:tetratricopeptide (TPR) repeat protein